MTYLKVLISSVISLIALFLLAKIIGNRQISQLTLFDYINGITIGSIAAEMATDLEMQWSQTLLAMLIYGLATALISYICCKSLKLRRFLNGRSVVVYSDGKFMLNGLKKARLDINEFLVQCRINGYFDLSQIELAVMEQNGKLSFLPKSGYRPVTPKDMALTVPNSQPSLSVIIDGVVLEQNLEALRINKGMLLTDMSKAGNDEMSTVMLATADLSGTVNFYQKHTVDTKNDMFM